MKREPVSSVSAEFLILQTLKRGPLPTGELADLAGISRRVVQRMVGPMCEAGKLEIYGNALEFGFQRSKGPSGFVYGVPRPGVRTLDLEGEDEPCARSGRRSAGSGVIAPRPYATGFRWSNV